MKVLKKAIIIVTIIAALLLLTIFIDNRLYNITLIGDKEIYLNINDEYFENGYKATFMNKDYDNVVVTNNIDNTKIGDYEVKYNIKNNLVNITKKRIIHVVDNENPEITLTGDAYTYINEHEEYKELGYAANDNYDGDITNKVITSSNINSEQVGVYEVKYEVSDSSNNKSTVTRKVEVIKDGLLSGGVSKFWLKNSFDDVILKYENQEYDYFKDCVFLGDSNMLFLNQKGKYLVEQQTWGRNNLNIAQINTSTFTTLADRKEHSLEEALNIYKPKYLILTTGINSAIYMPKDKLINEVERFINYMNEKHQETKIIFLSTFPITTGTLELSIQKKINEYNYYVVDICHKYHLNFINFADEVRAEDGYANKAYFDCVSETDCGFHLNKEGRAKFVDYIKHLNLERS